MLSLLQLPEDVWRDRIIPCLPSVDDLVGVEKAALNKTDRNALLRMIGGCCQTNAIYKPGLVNWLIVRNIQVESFLFRSGPYSESDADIQRVLSHAQQVTMVDCLNNAEEFRFVLETCHRTLTRLRLINLKITDISSLAMVSLTKLVLQNCSLITNDSFVIGISACRSLKECTIDSCRFIRGGSVSLLLNTCVHLESLAIYGSFDLDAIFGHSAPVCQLRRLASGGCASNLSGVTCRAISTMWPSLQHLNLAIANNTVADADITMLVTHCTQLQSLVLFRYHLVTDVSLCSIATHLPALREMHLHSCSITDQGVMTLAKGCTHLRTLKMCGFNITNAAVQAIGTHCQLLEDLNVSYCEGITDKAFATINVSKVCTLDVSATRVTGYFAARILCATSTVRTLICKNCQQLNHKFVQSIPLHNKLAKLEAHSVLLTDDERTEISTKLLHLTSLTINFVGRNVTNFVARSFVRHCRALNHFNFDGCSVSVSMEKELRVVCAKRN